jgi:hypothetical protein
MSKVEIRNYAIPLNLLFKTDKTDEAHENKLISARSNFNFFKTEIEKNRLRLRKKLIIKTLL